MLTAGVAQAALQLAKMDHAAVGKPLADDRLFDCVNVILSYQNADGGWATYENTRSYPLLEVRWRMHEVRMRGGHAAPCMAHNYVFQSML